MKVARKIAYNVLVSSISKVVSTVLALVVIGIITRYLGKDGFGDYATVLAFFSFFAALTDLGLYSISTREISRPGADQERIMSNIFTLRIISSLAVVVISPLIVWLFPYSQEVKYAIFVVAGAYLFSSAYQVLNGIFQKNLAMDRVAVAELLGRILQVAVVYLAVRMHLGFSWIIASILFYMVLSFLLVYLWSKKYIHITLRFDFSYWKTFLRQSYPVGIAAIITFVYFKIDTIMLSVMKSSTEVGIYNAAYKVIENISFFPAMLVGLIFPIMAQTIFHDRNKFEDISNKTFKVFVVTIVPIIIGTTFLSEGVIRIIGGAGFSESAPVLRILIFSLAFIFFGNFFNAVLVSGNMQKKLMFVLAFAAVFNIVANLLLIPRFSYSGAAYVSAITEFIVASATFYLGAKKLNYRPRLEKIYGIVLSGIVMAAFLYLGRGINFFALGSASVALYLAALWVFGAIKTSDITSIISKKGVEEYEPLS